MERVRSLSSSLRGAVGDAAISDFMDKYAYVYFLSNHYNNVIYVGVTSDLKKRVYQHKNKLVKGFTAKYNIKKLVYYEVFSLIVDAIKREKQIKAGSKAKKLDLVKTINPTFKDLYEQL